MFWNHARSWYSKQLEENVCALQKGEFGRIPWIFCALTERHDASMCAAARALAKALADMTFDDIVRIDAQMRDKTSMEWSIDWRTYQIEDFFASGMSEAERRAVIIFASLNPNGYIRERAVQRMLDDRDALPFIILRLNDWALQVRQIAAISFAQRMREATDAELCVALPYIEKIAHGGRGAQEQHIALFREQLIRPEHRGALENGLRSGLVRARRMCIRMLFASATPDTALALRHLRQEPDPFLRWLIFRALCDAGIQIDAAARVLLQDKFPRNRAMALRALHEAQAQDVPDIAAKCLLDKGAFVRALARTIVAAHDNAFDFPAFYIGALARQPVVAICGLGETGKAEDAPIIAPYLAQDNAAMVCATLAALMRLDSGTYRVALHDGLKDSRTSIVKTAQRLIAKYGVHDYATIRKVFWESPFDNTKSRCAELLFSAPKWESLQYMLEMLSCEQEDVRDAALQAILRWLHRFNRSHAQASAQQAERIRQLIAQLGDKLPDSSRQNILFVLP